MNRPSPHSQCALLVVKSVCSISKILVVWQSFTSVFFFSKGFLFFSKLHPSSQIFHSLNRKKNALNKKYWSVSEKNGSQTFPLFFSWQICIWTLLTFLKKKNQHLWRAKERKKIVDNQKRHELSFFFSLFQRKKKQTTHKKNKSNIWEQTKATWK